jgi:hypothetical protein
MIDRFHRALRERLDELVKRKQDELLLASGDTLEQIGLRYRETISYLRALNDVIDVAQAVEDKIYNPEKRGSL